MSYRHLITCKRLITQRKSILEESRVQHLPGVILGQTTLANGDGEVVAVNISQADVDGRGLRYIFVELFLSELEQTGLHLLLLFGRTPNTGSQSMCLLSVAHAIFVPRTKHQFTDTVYYCTFTLQEKNK